MPSRRRRFRARPKPQLKKPPFNEEIKSEEVRLIGADGEQLGVLSTQEALHIAAKADTDLVVVSEKANPPVTRLLDLGKYMYDKSKKQAKQKNTTKTNEIKGIRIGFKIGEHDWQLRLKQANDFLNEGHKVKLEIRLRGYEKGRLPLAEQKLKKFVANVPDGASIEGSIGKSTRGLSVLLTK